MTSFSTEVTSSKILSDRPLYLRTRKAYEIISNKAQGDTLEIGCGEGYGIPHYIENVRSLTLVDKSKSNLKKIKKTYPKCTFFFKRIPPLNMFEDNTFDTIISFQVIEHIKDYNLFLKEIKRVLKPSGKAYITTPNKLKTVAPNPWHYREFSFDELDALLKPLFKTYEILGIQGNSKTEEYYTKSNSSVLKILSFDIFNLHKHLPRVLLKIPYEILNRLNRASVFNVNKQLIEDINSNDYQLKPYNRDTLDLFCILNKEPIPSKNLKLKN